VALTHVPGEERTGKLDESDTASARDLDIVLMQPSDDTIIARGHWDLEIQDDAQRLESVAIDTGRYVLTEGKRAFGVRTINSTHCTCFNNGWGELTLFVQNEDRVDLVLRTEVSRWQEESDGSERSRPPCSLSSTEWRSTLAVGRRDHHGMSDLEQLTVKQAKYEADEVATQCPALPSNRTVTTWRFDGREYEELKAGSSR
jgi:hypothetical protein